LNPDLPARRRNEILGPYRLERRIRGDDGSELWLAREEALDRRVSLRIALTGDREAVARYLRAARTAAALDHPNILPVYRVGEEDRVIYVASRWVDGPTLDELLTREPVLPLARAADIVRQLGDALEFAHDREVAHGSVVPPNVELDDDHVYLTGFGLSLLSKSETPARELDVAALGNLLEQLLGGWPVRGPVGPVIAPVLVRARGEEPPPFASAAELGAAAARAAGPYRPATGLRPSIRRKWIVGVPIAGGAALVLTSAFLLVTRTGSPSEGSRVRNVIDRFASQSGGSACEQMTDRLVEAYGGLGKCRKALADRGSTQLSPDSVSVSGDVAEVEATSPRGKPYRLRLVRENGSWAIDAVSSTAGD
jgi:tRNA A-37 threonylcarbamoyl transferase component Bud32